MTDEWTRAEKRKAQSEQAKAIMDFVNMLSDKIADIKANCDLAIEGRDIKIKELEEENNKLFDVISNYEVKVADLEKDLNWERNTKSELDEHLGKANDKITELKKRNAELKGMYAHSAREAGTYKQFFEQLKKENAELKEKYNTLDKSLVTSTKNNIERQKIIDGLKEKNEVLERRIERAKECMKKLLFIINSDPANYNCKGLIQDAEDFIHNRTCNIRQQGEHCISETRCIMCDKEDGKVK